MKYLLDTSLIIEYLRGIKSIDISLLKQGSGISIITQAELFYGAYKSNKPRDNLTKIKQMIEDLGIRVLPLNEEIVEIYARLKASLETKGRRLDKFDLLIASTAISLNLSLITTNLKHFQRIPKLKLLPIR